MPVYIGSTVGRSQSSNSNFKSSKFISTFGDQMDFPVSMVTRKVLPVKSFGMRFLLLKAQAKKARRAARAAGAIRRPVADREAVVAEAAEEEAEEVAHAEEAHAEDEAAARAAGAIRRPVADREAVVAEAAEEEAEEVAEEEAHAEEAAQAEDEAEVIHEEEYAVATVDDGNTSSESAGRSSDEPESDNEAGDVVIPDLPFGEVVGTRFFTNEGCVAVHYKPPGNLLFAPEAVLVRSVDFLTELIAKNELPSLVQIDFKTGWTVEWNRIYSFCRNNHIPLDQGSQDGVRLEYSDFFSTTVYVWNWVYLLQHYSKPGFPLKPMIIIPTKMCSPSDADNILDYVSAKIEEPTIEAIEGTFTQITGVPFRSER